MSTASVAPPPAPRRSKLLMASLALNFLVLGLAGGAVFSRHRSGGRPDFNFGRLMGDPGLRGFLHTLPKDRRVALRDHSEAARLAARPLREAFQQARHEVGAAWNVVPVDPVRVEKAMSDLASADVAARRAGIAVLIAAIEHMTPDERSQFQAWRKKHENDPPPPPGAQPPHDDPPQPAQSPASKN